tara:strand:+ start:779 stop:1384 length:606 start_codon:yes stop_codon:yes gene_type:complete
MLKFLLATIISLSASVREPRQVPTAPFDYEFSYQIENTYKGFDGSLQHDYERQDGDRFNDITAELDYTVNLKRKGKELPNQQIILKEDYNQIASKDIYQFNSDIRYQFYGISAGYGMVWDLQDNYTFTPSIGLTKTIQLDKWELETENDVYFTKDITYQTEGQITYNVSKNVGLGISGNYIKTLDNYDYSAKVVLTIKLTK